MHRSVLCTVLFGALLLSALPLGAKADEYDDDLDQPDEPEADPVKDLTSANFEETIANNKFVLVGGRSKVVGAPFRHACLGTVHTLACRAQLASATRLHACVLVRQGLHLQCARLGAHSWHTHNTPVPSTSSCFHHCPDPRRSSSTVSFSPYSAGRKHTVARGP